MPARSMVLMPLPSPESRSISPLSTSPSSGKIRGLKLFRAISRKLSRRSHDDLHYCEDADSRSSSTDSCSSTSAGRGCPRAKKSDLSRSASPQRISSSSSDAGSESNLRRRHASVENFRKAFQGLSIRSQSCSGDKETKRKSKKNTQPKRILRIPITYTYVKGLSGLPTQRVPRSQPRAYARGPCICNASHLGGLQW